MHFAYESERVKVHSFLSNGYPCVQGAGVCVCVCVCVMMNNTLYLAKTQCVYTCMCDVINDTSFLNLHVYWCFTDIHSRGLPFPPSSQPGSYSLYSFKFYSLRL